MEIPGLVASPPPEDIMDQNLQEMMESFLDVDQFLLADKHVTQFSQPQFTSPVNQEHDTTFSINDDHDTHNHSSEVKFSDAWDLLNAMESDSHASFESILNCISTMDKPLLENDNMTTINTPGLDVSALLSNEPILPFDVSTPDVDTTILTSDIPEFFSNSMIDNIQTPTEIPIIDKQNQDKESTYQDLSQTLSSDASDSILRLNVGQSLDNFITGNGAQLQLKRKASQGIKIENVKTESKSENVMTIIIKFGNENEDESEPSLKRQRSEDKYDEMRRKNNEASKRCRQNRKSKQSDMEKLAEQLEADNKKLAETVAKLEREIQTTRAQFIKIFQSKVAK